MNGNIWILPILLLALFGNNKNTILINKINNSYYKYNKYGDDE